MIGGLLEEIKEIQQFNFETSCILAKDFYAVFELTCFLKELLYIHNNEKFHNHTRLQTFKM